jgi:hypothetical protein
LEDDLFALGLVVVVDPVVDLSNKVVDVPGLVSNEGRYFESGSFRENKKSSASKNFGDTVRPITIGSCETRISDHDTNGSVEVVEVVLSDSLVYSEVGAISFLESVDHERSEGVFRVIPVRSCKANGGVVLGGRLPEVTISFHNCGR